MTTPAPDTQRLVRYCDACRQKDDHPRHIHVGPEGRVNNKHFDCCHNAACPAATASRAGGVCGVVMMMTRRARGDALTGWLGSRIASMGPDFDAWIKAGAPIAGGAGGLDQNRVIDILNVITGYSANTSTPFTAVLATPFTSVSGGTNGGHILLMTANGSSTANGTALASGGSYIYLSAGQPVGIQYNTGSSGAFTIATYGTGSAASDNSTTLSQTGMPTANVAGIETWDSAAAGGKRWIWTPLTSPISTNPGDTLSFAATAITGTFTA